MHGNSPDLPLSTETGANSGTALTRLLLNGVLSLHRLRGLWRYGLSVLAVGLALMVTLLLQQQLPEKGFFLPFFAAMTIAAGVGGLGPGVLATILSAMICEYFFFPPLYTLTIARQDQLPVALFLLAGFLVSALSELLHIAHQQAQTQSERDRFLADASALLDASLDYEATLAQVARLAVPYLADYCFIDLLAADRSFRRLEVASLAPVRDPLAGQLQRGFTVASGAACTMARVARTGRSEVGTNVAEAIFMMDAGGTERNMTAYMCVPMTARGRVFGTITFIATEPRQEYGPADLVLAEHLAVRIALAMDSAQLYQAAQEEIAERRRTETILMQKQAEIETLNRRLRQSITETHHRVKNHLQVLSAIVDMQLLKDTETLPSDEFRQLGRQMRTLALIHDLLAHESEADAAGYAVSVKSVLEQLLSLIQQTVGNRALEYQVEEATVSAVQSTALARVVNELVSNAIKHSRGRVEVVFRMEDRSGVLRVTDDGPGFPEEFDPVKAAHIGLDLVENISRRDLDGQVGYENRNEGGGKVTVTFPLSEAS